MSVPQMSKCLKAYHKAAQRRAGSEKRRELDTTFQEGRRDGYLNGRSEGLREGRRFSAKPPPPPLAAEVFQELSRSLARGLAEKIIKENDLSVPEGLVIRVAERLWDERHVNMMWDIDAQIDFDMARYQYEFSLRASPKPYEVRCVLPAVTMRTLSPK